MPDRVTIYTLRGGGKMKLKAKFIDIGTESDQLNIATVTYPAGYAPMGIEGDEQLIVGKKRFLEVPEISSDIADPAAISEADHIGTVAYISGLVAKLAGYGAQETITLTSTDISNKYVTLSRPASVSLLGAVCVNLYKGPELAIDIDFNVSSDGTMIGWNGFTLDGVISEGDKLQVFYKSDFPPSPPATDILEHFNEADLLTGEFQFYAGGPAASFSTAPVLITASTEYNDSEWPEPFWMKTVSAVYFRDCSGTTVNGKTKVEE